MVTVIGAIVSAVVPTFSVLWVSVYSKQAKVTRNLANLQYSDLENRELDKHYKMLNSEIISPFRTLNLGYPASPLGNAFPQLSYPIDVFQNKFTGEMGKKHISKSNPQFEETVKKVKELVMKYNLEFLQD